MTDSSRNSSTFLVLLLGVQIIVMTRKAVVIKKIGKIQIPRMMKTTKLHMDEKLDLNSEGILNYTRTWEHQFEF